jgi:hypothetical protein
VTKVVAIEGPEGLIGLARLIRGCAAGVDPDLWARAVRLAALAVEAGAIPPSVLYDVRLIGPRTASVLRLNGVRDLRALTAVSPTTVLAWVNSGRRTLVEIERALAFFDLALAPAPAVVAAR